MGRGGRVIDIIYLKYKKGQGHINYLNIILPFFSWLLPWGMPLPVERQY